MHARLSLAVVVRIVVVGLVLTICTPIQMVQPTQAQTQAPFLTTPYYGYHGINSYFDHEYPDYQPNSTFTRYDGSRWTNMSDCTIGVNCYDGHNGYDFVMQYESVLAAADGSIGDSGWQIPNCRSGVSCQYGLRLEINHDNGYITRYGHLSAAMTSGQRVSAGQAIGTSGTTGNSTGPHLHFDIGMRASNTSIPSVGKAPARIPIKLGVGQPVGACGRTVSGLTSAAVPVNPCPS
jgi:murein DD-endopeptidase MepM/ murein hydrolase activator NlpD